MNNRPGSFHGEMILFCDTKKLQVGKYYAMVEYTRGPYHNIGYTTCYFNRQQEYVGWYKGRTVDGIQVVFEENGMERVIESPRYPASISFIEAEPPLIYSYVLK